MRRQMQRFNRHSDMWKYIKLLFAYLISTICLSCILSRCESKGNIYFTAFHAVKSPEAHL